MIVIVYPIIEMFAISFLIFNFFKINNPKVELNRHTVFRNRIVFLLNVLIVIVFGILSIVEIPWGWKFATFQ